MKRALPWLTIAFSSGIFFTRFWQAGILWLYLFCALILALGFALAKKERISEAILLCLFFLLGAIVSAGHKAPAQNDISKFVYYQTHSPYLVKGIIQSPPQYKNNRTTFILQPQAIEGESGSHTSSGDIQVFIKGKQELSYGEEIILKGMLCRPFSKNAPGRAGYSDYLYNRGILLVMRVKNPFEVARLNKNRSSPVKRLALGLKDKIESIIYKYTSPPAAGILSAMLLGEKRGVPYFLTAAMMKTGTIHILVVSGFNVGIVAAIVILLLKVIGLKQRARIYITIPWLLFYCLLTGASTPVARATIMAIFLVAAYLIKREPDIYNSLSMAALFILWINPRQLFDIGFQLSFASVFAIVYLYPKIRALSRIEQLKIIPIRYLIDGVLVSFSAWLGTMGFIAYYFRIFSPVTVLANLFIVPLATLITLCGFSLIAVSLIFPPLSGLFANSCEFLASLLVNLNLWLSNIPGASLFLFN